MARVNLITGSWDGKVGQLVGAKWKDKKTLRAYAKPSNPNTAAQQEKRAVFKGMTEYVALFSDGIKQLTSLNTRGMTVRNAIIQANKEQFAGGTVEYDDLIVNKGGLAQLIDIQGSDNAGEVVVTYETPTATNISTNAKVVSVLVVPSKKVAFVKEVPFNKKEIKFGYDLETGTNAWIYTWVIDYRGSTRVGSNSQAIKITG